jgi:hypothetical protein
MITPIWWWNVNAKFAIMADNPQSHTVESTRMKIPTLIFSSYFVIHDNCFNAFNCCAIQINTRTSYGKQAYESPKSQ